MRAAGLGGLAPTRGLFPQGCAPHFLFETSKRKCAAPGGKEKMFGGSVCASADLLPPAGDGWHSLVEVRDGNARPLGKALARGSLRYTLLHFSLPLTVPRGSWRNGPMRASAPTTTRGARSEAERAERETGQMRACTPTQDAPAPRESAVKSASHPAAPVGESSQIRRHHLTPTPVQQLCTDVQSCDQSVFSLWTVHGPFLFWQDQKRNGGCIGTSRQPG